MLSETEIWASIKDTNARSVRSIWVLLFSTFMMIFLASVRCDAQLSPDFKADTSAGCTPLIVQFHDLSTGMPTKWFWDLGNGITSTSQHPTTFYFEPGNYTISLTVTNGSGSKTITRQQYITAYGVPNVNFIATTDTVGCVPFTARFKDLSDPVSGSVAAVEWDYGDGNFSKDRNGEHTYGVAGNFTVLLRVTNSYGCSQVKGTPSYIEVKEGVTAKFGITDTFFCSLPASTQFTDSSTGSRISKYFWDFGDGTNATTSNPQHRFGNRGTFTVTLAVANVAGCTDTFTRQSAVVIGTGNPQFSFTDSVCRKEPVTFTNQSVPLPVQSLWSFGDGTGSTDKDPLKSFATAKTYTVKLVNFYNTCNDTLEKSITVVGGPSAGFSENKPTTACSAPLSVTFNSTTQNVQSYLWKFDDSSSSTLPNPTHTFTKPGSYDVSVMVTAGNGCTDTLTKKGLVYIGPPAIESINQLPFNNCAPATVPFVANIKIPEPIASYVWNFGDGSSSTQATPSHRYNNTGAYTVTLAVKTINGCVGTYTLPNAVVLNTRPKALFTAQPTVGCAQQDIRFNNTSLGEMTSWLWDFGDGTTSDQRNPIHQYSDSGHFSVSLIVRKDACADSVQLSNLIHITPPVAKFSKEFDCKAPGVINFKDQSTGAAAWRWDFGDGAKSVEANPIHPFKASGKYKVMLEVTNGACRQTFSELITVINETPQIKVAATEICKNTNMQFTAVVTNENYIQSYQWRFGDGENVTTAKSVVDYTYTNAAFYLPKLIVTDLNGCMDSATTSLPVKVYGPTARFAVAGGNCLNTPLVFSDSSSAFKGYNIVSRSWNFDDGTVLNQGLGQVNHNYSSIGLYKPVLTVTDSRGCTDSTKATTTVLITNPVASFKISDSTICTGSAITFSNESKGTGLQYAWNFGDGQTARSNQVNHQYGSQGSYNISLAITDTFGCRDVMYKPMGVTIANVRATFNISDTASSCPPFKVALKNQSANYSFLRWNFDDGGFSNLEAPLHYYIIPGIYRLTLIANGYGGCSDTAYQNIVLKGPTGDFKYDPKDICNSGKVNFQAKSSSRTFLIWDYGNGNTFKTTDSLISYNYNDPGKYVPKVLLVDQSGCQVPIVGKDTISIISVDAKLATVKMLYCDSATVYFADSSQVLYDEVEKYTWNYGDGIIETTTSEPQHTYTRPGNYRVSLKLETTKGCSDTVSLPAVLRVVQSPAISIQAKNSVCINEPILFRGLLSAPDTSAINWNWVFGNSRTVNVQNPGAQVFSTPGVQTVTALATNSSGCTALLNFPLQVNALPVVNAGNDTTICLQTAITLRPTGAEQYVWSANSTLSCTNCANSVAEPTGKTGYSLVGTSRDGCRNTDTINIDVIKPFKITTRRFDTLCIGRSVVLSAAGTDRFTWTPSQGLNNAAIANPVATPLQTTIYQVVATDSQNCFVDTGFVTVSVYPIPRVNVTEENVTLNIGSKVPLHSTSSSDVNSWKWIPYAGLSCTNCAEPIAGPRNTTTYTVEATNQGGCKSRDQVTVTVICNNANVFVPNTFSPNNDGMNDLFFPRGKGVAHIKSFTVFNRWGAVIFQKNNFDINDAQAGWDGTFNGTMVGPDVYMYNLDVVCDNSEIFNIKGNITLIR